MDFSYTFPAVKGIQAKKEYFITMIPLKYLVKILPEPGEYLTPEYRAQRRINELRIPGIKNYILDNKDSYIFSSLTASIDGEYIFEKSTIENVGLLHINMDARILINDGQHRRAAIAQALLEDDSIEDETISVREYSLSEKEGTYLTSIEVLNEIAKMGGVGYIAHIDTSNTFHEDYLNGAYKKKLFELECNQIIGISEYGKKEIVEKSLKAFTKKEFCFFIDEDAHSIDKIGSQCLWIKGSKINFSMIKDAVRDYEISIDYVEPHELNNYIRGVYVDGDGKNFLSGKENNQLSLSFSDALNCIIGGRGTGKSSILQILEFVIRQHCPNEETLEFICNHKNIWVLIRYNGEEYMIHFSAPIKEYEDDQVMKYFRDDRYHRYGYRYYFNEFDVEDYALRHYIEIKRLSFNNSHLFCETVSDKKRYLQKFFNVKYSVNELVKTASGDEINTFIYNTLFQNVTIDNAARVVNARSSNGLKRVVSEMDSLMEKRKKDVHKVIDEFNERETGVLRIVYNMDGRREYFDFEKIFNRKNMGYYFHKYNMLTENVAQSQILWDKGFLT